MQKFEGYNTLYGVGSACVSLYWNGRGMANQSTKLALKNFCLSHRSNFLFVFEPWIAIDHISFVFQSTIKLNLFVINDRGSVNTEL